MCASDVRTTGYRLADGRYFVIEDESGEIVAIRQILFGCGIYPAPVKDVPKNEWPEVLTMTSFSECYKKDFLPALGGHVLLLRCDEKVGHAFRARVRHH